MLECLPSRVIQQQHFTPFTFAPPEWLTNHWDLVRTHMLKNNDITYLGAKKSCSRICRVQVRNSFFSKVEIIIGFSEVKQCRWVELQASFTLVPGYAIAPRTALPIPTKSGIIAVPYLKHHFNHNMRANKTTMIHRKELKYTKLPLYSFYER
jgi:hypothetical protein